MLIQTQLMACIFQTSTLSCDHIFQRFHLSGSCVHSPSSSLECTKQKVFPNILPQQGEQKNSRYFRATVFGNGSGFGKYLKKHYFYLVKMRHCTSWSSSCLVSFGVFWLSLVFYGVPSCLWPLLFQGGLISRFMFIFDRSDEKLKLWWNSSVLIMKHFDLMKWPRN